MRRSFYKNFKCLLRFRFRWKAGEVAVRRQDIGGTTDGAGSEPQEQRELHGLAVALRHTMLWRFGVARTKCGVYP
jgi:hypothetical protein